MSLKIKGLDELPKLLIGRTEKITKAIDKELTEAAKAVEGRAETLAPVDRGGLRGQIFADTSVFLNKRVVSAAQYAAYLEFGTKRRFRGNGREQIAKQYQGKGQGDYFDFLNAILDWVIRNNIGGQTTAKGGRSRSKSARAGQLAAAQAIANSIMRNGIHPANNGTGYFFRSYDELLPTILKNIENILK